MTLIRGLRRAGAAVVALTALVALLSAGAAQGQPSFSISTIPTPSLPFGMVVDDVAHRGYVVQTDRLGVLVIDTRSKQVRGRILIDGFTGALAVDPDRHRLYAAVSDQSMAEIDTDSRAIVRRPRVGIDVGGIFLEPDTHELYVTDGTRIRVVDPERRHLPVGTVRLPGVVGSVAFDPADHRAYVSYLNAPGVTAIDTTSHTAGSTFGCGAGLCVVAFDRSARRLYVIGQDRLVRVYSLPRRRLVATFADPDPSGAAEVAFDADLRLAYIAHDLAGSTVTIVDTASYSVLASVSTGISPEVALDTGTHDAFVPSISDSLITVITPVGRDHPSASTERQSVATRP